MPALPTSYYDTYTLTIVCFRNENARGKTIVFLLRGDASIGVIVSLVEHDQILLLGTLGSYDKSNVRGRLQNGTRFYLLHLNLFFFVYFIVSVNYNVV